MILLFYDIILEAQPTWGPVVLYAVCEMRFTPLVIAQYHNLTTQ